MFVIWVSYFACKSIFGGHNWTRTHSRLFFLKTVSRLLLRVWVTQLFFLSWNNLSFKKVCVGNVVTVSPSMMTWTLDKKVARSEPAEMGVPFSDHSAISRSNKRNTHPCSFYLWQFLFFICICLMLDFLQSWGLYFVSVCCNNSPLLGLLKWTNVLHRCHVSMLCRGSRSILYLL